MRSTRLPSTHTAMEAAAGERLPYELELDSARSRAKEGVKRILSLAATPLAPMIRVATREAAVAFTFDDGPDPESTLRVLELLERHGARGTFFMVGKSARRHPEVVARVVAGGHAVANHSWDHSSFRLVRGALQSAQIRWCSRQLAPHGLPLFRPPFGELTAGALVRARLAGHEVVCWDVVGEDWTDQGAEFVYGRMIRRLRRGSIVLLHDALYATSEERFRARAPMLEALARLLSELAGRYRCVTLPELLRLGRPVRWPWTFRLPLEFHRELV